MCLTLRGQPFISQKLRTEVRLIKTYNFSITSALLYQLNYYLYARTNYALTKYARTGEWNYA